MAVSEAWRDVPGYGGKYQASDMGRIANTFWHGRRRQNGGRTILAQFKKKPRGKARDSARGPSGACPARRPPICPEELARYLNFTTKRGWNT